MLNRNAARHLLLVVSILLFAFIFAGYYLVTRGDAPPSGASPAQDAPGLILPDGGDGTQGIPSASGDDLALAPAVATSARPLSPPPAAVAPSGDDVITGLVPGESDVADASSSPQPMEGTVLPLPGFSAPSEPEESRSPPVLTLPGMGAAPSADDGNAAVDEYADGEEDGDFAALPGLDSSSPSASVPPPAAAPSSSPASPQGGTSLALPPVESSAVSSAPPSAGAGAALRPPPMRQGGGDGGPAADSSSAPSRPLSARTAPPPPSGQGGGVPAGTAETDSPLPSPPSLRAQPGPRLSGDPEPRSDSLRIYVVASGDTLSSIAMRELGSGFLADNIFLLNRDVIDDPNQLPAGVKIRLPYANPDFDSDPAAVGAPGRRPTQGLGSTHTVARGDTLSSIALRYYGTSSGWRFLYEANKAIVPNPNQLTVGMDLTIPPYEQ